MPGEEFTSTHKEGVRGHVDTSNSNPVILSSPHFLSCLVHPCVKVAPGLAPRTFALEATGGTSAGENPHRGNSWRAG